MTHDRCLTSRRSQPPLALAVPLSRFTPRVGGGSAFFVRPHSAHMQIPHSSMPSPLCVVAPEEADKGGGEDHLRIARHVCFGCWTTSTGWWIRLIIVHYCGLRCPTCLKDALMRLVWFVSRRFCCGVGVGGGAFCWVVVLVWARGGCLFGYFWAPGFCGGVCFVCLVGGRLVWFGGWAVGGLVGGEGGGGGDKGGREM